MTRKSDLSAAPIEQAAQALRLVIESTRMHPQVRADVDAALARLAPGHTDLMVPPETIDVEPSPAHIPSGMETTAEERAEWAEMFTGKLNEIGSFPRTLRDLDRALAEIERTRDAWMETAAFHHRNEEYYRGLVIQIGEMLPLPDAYVSDDGSGQDSVLCAKVSELVQALVARLTEMDDL